MLFGKRRQASGSSEFIAPAQALADFILSLLRKVASPGYWRWSWRRRWLCICLGGLWNRHVESSISQAHFTIFLALSKGYVPAVNTFERPVTDGFVDFDTTRLTIDAGQDTCIGTRENALDLNRGKWVGWWWWNGWSGWSRNG